MAAPKGNQFWKLRSKHGRDKIFKTPEQLKKAAEEYFQWCDDHPWYKNIAIKAGKQYGECVQEATVRPYTLTSLCLYLGVSKNYFREFKKTANEGFLEVIDYIEAVIETHQFEGAVVGVFNANIISRKLGLADKSQTEIKVDLDLAEAIKMARERAKPQS